MEIARKVVTLAPALRGTCLLLRDEEWGKPGKEIAVKSGES